MGAISFILFEKKSSGSSQRPPLCDDGNSSGSIRVKNLFAPFLAEKEEITKPMSHCISGFKDAIQDSFSMFLNNHDLTLAVAVLVHFSTMRNSWYCIKINVSKPVP